MAHSSLQDFAAVQSDDLVKTNLELTCLRCAAVLCDIEHDDTLDVLVSVAEAHVEDHHIREQKGTT